MGNCFAKGKPSEDEGEGKEEQSPNLRNYGTMIRQPRVWNSGPQQGGPSGSSCNDLVLKDPTGHDIRKKYELGGELGRGSVGVMYVCTDKESGGKFACKYIAKDRLRAPIEVENLRREVEIMRHLPKHPNIMGLKEAYEDNNAVYLVMELCEGGDLFHRISSRGCYTEREAAAALRTIVEVVEICHRNGVMHRDLKPENFVYADKSDKAPLKVIDFGISVFFQPGDVFTQGMGTAPYIAPEVLKQKYGPEADVWSAGVILYVLLSGLYPWWSDTDEKIFKEILGSVVSFSKDPWPMVSNRAKDLVKRMLNPNPKRRLTAQEVLGHPWLQKADPSENVSLGEEVKARLRQFSAMNKFKKLALRVIADNLSEYEVEALKERFKKMDVSNRGKINNDELRAGLQQSLGHPVPDADLQSVMEAADDNRDGYIDYDEFASVSVHLRELANDQHLRKAFNFFDLNKNGYIEIEDLRHALADKLDANGEKVIDAIMRDVDTDKDGKISFDEFVAMMKAGAGCRQLSRGYSQEQFNNFSLNSTKGESSQTKQ